MSKFHEVVPPFGVGWVFFVQATDPATDPNNMVGPGKGWVEVDDDTAPTAVTAIHTWNVDDSGWLTWPVGAASSGGDADTLDGIDSLGFVKQALADAVGDLIYGSAADAWAKLTGNITTTKKFLTQTGNGAASAAPGWNTIVSGDIPSSVALAGSPTTTTQSASDNSTKIATTAYVDSAVTAGAGAPASADYLVKTANGSLSAERVVTDTTSIVWDWATGGQAKATRAALTGDVTASADSNATTIANDAVTTVKILNANVTGGKIASSVALAGSPTTTTQSAGDNSTKISTTAYTDNAVAKQAETLIVAASDETTAITTGTAKVTFYMPFAFTLVDVFAGLSAQSTSGAPAFDINKAGVSIFSTTLTIDANEDTSLTAATPAVITTTSFSKGDKITVDIDTAGTGAKGVKIVMNGTRT